LELRYILTFYCAHDLSDFSYWKQTFSSFVIEMFYIRQSVKDGKARVRYNDTGLRRK